MIRSKKWWLITLKGIIFLFLGIYMFRYPVSGMLGLIVYGGISLFLSGIMLIVFSLSTRNTHMGWIWQMSEGLLDVLISIILLLNIGLTAITFPYAFAFYGILTGLFWTIQSTFYRRKKYIFWPVALLAGVFSILIGILIFFHPVIAAFSIIDIIGIMFIAHGFFLTLFSIEISRINKDSSGR